MHPELFTTGVFIGDYSLRRRPRCGATTEADNNNVDTAAIEPINRRSKREEARGIEARISMCHVTHKYPKPLWYIYASLRIIR